MRKTVFFLLFLCVPISMFGQDWRNRPPHSYYDNSFDLTPFLGYRYGGTIYADQTNLFNQNVNVESGMNYGVNFGVPVGNGWKVEFSVDRQDTHFTEGGGGGLFNPSGNLAGFHVTYFQGGLMIPFAQSPRATPYVVFGAGVANLHPDVAGVSADTRFAMHGGIGVKIPLARNTGIRIEEKGFFTSLGSNNSCDHCHYTYNNDLVQGETNFGVYFKF